MKNDISKTLTDSELVILCNDIYDWTHGDGTLNPKSELRKLYDQHRIRYELYDMRVLEDLILAEAHERFSKMAKALILHRPNWFIK